eukprot:5535946-Pleurochrysis_carterae.AAC.1
MANAVDCGKGADAAAIGGQHAAPRAEAAVEAGAAGSATTETAASAEPARSDPAGAAAECGWRADVSAF